MKTVKAAADTFRKNPRFDTQEALGRLGTGEALVSFLDASGAPSPVQRVTVLPPESRIGTITDEERLECMGSDAIGLKYDAVFDRESAYEILAEGIREAEYGTLQPLPGGGEAPAAPMPAPAVFKVYDPASGAYVEREMLPVQAPAYPAPAQYAAPAAFASPAPSRSAPQAHRPVQPRSTVRVSAPRGRSSGSAIDSFARSALNSAGRTLGSTLTRGLLDTLGLGRKKRR